MSSNFQQSNLSEQFKKAISDGLSSGDFKELNILVNDTVTEVIAEAGKQVKNVSNTTYRTTAKVYESAREYEEQQKQRNERFKKTSATSAQLQYGYPQSNKTSLPALKTKNVGQISSVLRMTFGGIGLATATGLGITAFILSFINMGLSTPFWISFGILFVISFFSFRKGSGERKRLSRMKRYLALFADKMYINLSDLAEHTGKSTDYILKDIRKMLALGFFPEGHLDKNETCLMLDDATYREYLRLEKERNTYELECAASNSANTAPHSATAGIDTTDTHSDSSNTSDSGSTNPELLTMVREGKEYIRKLHELNDIIPGEVISAKMYRMEDLLKEIFQRLEEDPTQMSQMHKLMNYYLPTTIKLLQSYSEFDDISVPGTDVINAKAEIEKTVDIINEAFAELLNKLFQATVFDATTDAQVLQTMLAKEGLTKNDFAE